MPLPITWEEKDFTPIKDKTREDLACILDDTTILPIPRPKNKKQEDELVENFVRGVQKLFTPENNWTMYQQLITTIEHCAKCNTCSSRVTSTRQAAETRCTVRRTARRSSAASTRSM